MFENIVVFPGLSSDDDTVDDLVLVAPGTYEAAYVNYDLHGAYGGRLAVNFRIMTMGTAAFEKVLAAWYRVRIIDRKRGTFKAAKHSKFARDWRVIFGHGVARWDRVPMTGFKGIVVKARVRTVETDHHGHELNPINRYSVIDELLGRVEG